MKRTYIKMIILAGVLSLACTTRVSEWVLLNIQPNQYTLVYFYDSPLSEEVKKQNLALGESFKNANIQFKSEGSQAIKEPYYGLYYQGRLFSKYKSRKELNNLTVSPLRQKIAAELMEGRLCVLLYLKTDNKEKDEKGVRIVRNAIEASPFGKIITLYELSRNSVEESHFASLLLNVEDDLKAIQEPMVFGIFGRFKALEPLLGRGITEENINLMINYLTAECSCLIKDDLPGTDILFAGKWENPKTALLNKILDNNPSPGN